MEEIKIDKHMPYYKVFTKIDDSYVETIIQNSLQSVAGWNTTDELLYSLLKYKTHLEENADHLIEFGYPKTAFIHDRWLDSLLTITYPTKVPANVYGEYLSFQNIPLFINIRNEILENAENGVFYQYSWTKRCQLDNFLNTSYSPFREYDINYAQKQYNIEFCSYEEAEFIQSNTIECYADWIEKLRPKLIDIKLKTIELCIKYLQLKLSEPNIVEEFLIYLCEKLTVDEMEVLFVVEEAYSDLHINESLVDYLKYLYNYNFMSVPFITPEFAYQPNKIGANNLKGFNINKIADTYEDEEELVNFNIQGGLYLLFWFASHIEKEIKIGTISTIKQQAINEKKENETFSYILNLFDDPALYTAEEQYWTIFQSKVKHVLENELMVKKSIPAPPMKAKFFNKWWPYINKIVQFNIDYLNKTGKLYDENMAGLKVKDGTKEIEDKEPEYMFHKAGEFFVIRFGFIDELYFPEDLGFNYIHYLLRNAGIELWVTDLVTIVNPKSIYVPTTQKDRNDVHKDIDYYKVVSDEAREQYKEKIMELKEKKTLASEAEEYDKVFKYEQEMEVILKEINNTSSFPDPILEGARKSVWKAVRDSKNKIKKHCEPLFLHIDKCVKTGKRVIYESDREIDWIL